MKNTVFNLLFLTLLITLISCATVQEKELAGATALKQGMAPFEVVHLLGLPSRVIKFYDRDVLYLYNTVRVVFRDNVVAFAFDNVEPVYAYKVDALGDGKTFKKSIYFISSNPEISENDLNFKEYVSQLEKAAKLFGFQVSSEKGSADTLVLVDYKNIKQKETEISTRLVETSIYISPTTSYTSLLGGSSATTRTNGSTAFTQTPITESKTVVYYERQLSCEAVAAKEYLASKKKIPQWKVGLTGSGSWGDFRRVFGTMALAAARAFNKNSNGQVDSLIVSNDPYLPPISNMYDAAKTMGWFSTPRGESAFQYEGLANKDSVNSSEPSGITLLAAAVITEDVDAIKKLISAGADPNGSMPPGELLLIKLVKNHNWTIARMLVDLGADPTLSLEGTDGPTEKHNAVFYAKSNNKMDLVKYFEEVAKTRRATKKASL